MRFIALAWGRSLRWYSARLIVANTKALAIVIAPTLLFLLPFVLPPVDHVAGIAVVVDGAMGVRVPVLASLSLIPTAQLPAGGALTDRKGSVAFLVMLNSYCRNHCLDPS